ncbi:MAG: hypothetical protein H0W64_10995 [Gammaproteobacteria bacterium]|nr:hypothetical protein [Gammaproteobacteria bacterium]
MKMFVNLKFFLYVGSIILCMLAFNIVFAASNDFHRVSLYGGNLTINIPSSFNSPPEDDSISRFAELDTKQKFSGWNKPKYVFVDKNHNNIIVDLIKSRSTLDDYLNNLEQFVKQQNPYATVYEKRKLIINGHNFVMVKVKSPMPDSSTLYNCTIATIVHNKRLEFLIFLNDSNYKNWNDIIQKIVASIKINE